VFCQVLNDAIRPSMLLEVFEFIQFFITKAQVIHL
jgi:hypothetical protein